MVVPMGQGSARMERRAVGKATEVQTDMHSQCCMTQEEAASPVVRRA